MTHRPRPDDRSVAFSVSVTPQKRAREEDEVLYAILAPFNKPPKVAFEDVNINEEVKKQVFLRNPTQHSMHVKLDKLPDKDRGFQFNSVDFLIEPESQAVLEIRWNPVEYGSWHDNIKICYVGKSSRALSEIKITTSTVDPPKRFKGKPMKAKKCHKTENKENIQKPAKTNININTKNHGLVGLNETFSLPNNTPRRTTYEVLAPISPASRTKYQLRNRQISNIADLEEERLSFESLAIPKDINTSLEAAAMKLTDSDGLEKQLISVLTLKNDQRYLSKRETYEIPLTASSLTSQQSPFSQCTAESYSCTLRTNRCLKPCTIVSSNCPQDSATVTSNSMGSSEIKISPVETTSTCSSSLKETVNILPVAESTGCDLPSDVLAERSDVYSSIQIKCSNQRVRRSADSQASSMSRDSLEMSLNLLEFPENKHLAMIDDINFDTLVGFDRKFVVKSRESEVEELDEISLLSLDMKRFSDISDSYPQLSRSEIQPTPFQMPLKEKEIFESNRICVSENQFVTVQDTHNKEECRNQNVIIVNEFLQPQHSVGAHCDEISSTLEFDISGFAQLERNPDIVCSSPLNLKNSNTAHNSVVEGNTIANKHNISELLYHTKENILGIVEDDGGMTKAVLHPLLIKDEHKTPNSFRNSDHTIEHDQGIAEAVLHPLLIKEEPLDQTSSTASFDYLLSEVIIKSESSEPSIHENNHTYTYIDLKPQEEEVERSVIGSLNTTREILSNTMKGASKMKDKVRHDSDQHDGQLRNMPSKKSLMWTVLPPTPADKGQVNQIGSNKMDRFQNLRKLSVPSLSKRTSLLPNSASSKCNSSKLNASGPARRSLAPSSDVFLIPKQRSVKRAVPHSKASGTSPPKLRRAATQERLKRLNTPTSLRKCSADTLRRPGYEARSAPRTAPSSRKRTIQKAADWLPARKLKLHFSTSSDSECSSGHPTPANHDSSEPNPFLAATSMNPFIKGGLYMGEQWLQEQEWELISWTNNMLQPPSELQLDRDQAADGTLHRLNNLRATVYNILTSDQVATVLAKIKETVERKILCIRKDKDLHADLGLQDIVLKMLMSYHPLWLRLCLEAVYQCTIVMRRHDDYNGLSKFIRTRVLHDSYFHQIYSHPTIPNYMMPEFEEKMKKFTLYKFLTLVYLLDTVKTRKIILHDPCFFRIDANFKSSKDILIEFNKEFIAAGGDIVKKLKLRGYEVFHVQSYLDEFDFSVRHRSDLRDGVRLSKLAEIITRNKHLCGKLRVPALNSLQKKFNAEVAFSALKEAGFPMLDDVTSKDIADGHREKTLSFLWHLKQIVQKNAVLLIIQKWRETKNLREDRKRFLKIKSSVLTLQRWYRRIKQGQNRTSDEIREGVMLRQNFIKLRSTVVFVQRRYRDRKEKKNNAERNKAAIMIQQWYRNKKATENDRKLYKSQINSVLIIQRAFRNYAAKKVSLESEERVFYIKLKMSTIKIQQWYRAYKAAKTEKESYQSKRKAVIVIQKRFRAYKLLKSQREDFIVKRAAVVTLQRRFRSHREMKRQRERFLMIKQAAVLIQRRLRTYMIGNQERHYYLRKRAAAITIQRCFRSYKQMKLQRQHFLLIRQTAILIQGRFRARRIGKQERDSYLMKHRAALTLQKHVRAYKQMKQQQQKYIMIKQSAILIQRRFRARKIGKQVRDSYLIKLAAVLTIQKQFRAFKALKQQQKKYLMMKQSAILIQRRFRAHKEMKEQRQKYLLMRESAILIQRRFRAHKKMMKQHQKYLLMKQSAILIQRRFRAYRIQKQERDCFVMKRRAALIIQQYFRSCKETKRQSQKYLRMKQAAILIQVRFRAHKIGKLERDSFVIKRTAALVVQNYFRSSKKMKLQRQKYLLIKQSAILIQRRFRANKEMKQQRQKYFKMKDSAILVQRRFRANKKMKHQHHKYMLMKQSAILIQKWFRGYRIGKRERESFMLKRRAASIIQKHFRSCKEMKLQNQKYLMMRGSAILIQRKFRAHKEMKQQRQKYLLVRESAILIQRRFRAHKEMKQQHQKYLLVRESAILVQRRFRANKKMKHQHHKYMLMKQSAILIQKWFRGYRIGKRERESFMLKRRAASIIQKHFRSCKEMKLQNQKYLMMRGSAILIQRKFRAHKEMKQQRQKYLLVRESAILIQRRFRAHKEMKQQHQKYLLVRESAILIQRRFRAYKEMKQQRQKYLLVRESAILIQRRFRAHKEMKQQRQKYLMVRESAILIQRRFRAHKEIKQQRQTYLLVRESAILIQRRFRAYKEMKQQRQKYLLVRESAILIQRKFRAHNEMKKQRQQYLLVGESAILIQRRFRAHKEMKQQRQKYLLVRESAVLIQGRFRAYKEMKQQRQKYLLVRESAILIQRKFRAHKEMKKQRQQYLLVRESIILIQRRFRAHKEMKQQRQKYLLVRESAVLVQRRFRAYKEMKQQHQKYLLIRESAILIQERFRAYTKGKHVRGCYLTKRNAAITIQKYFRCYQETKQQHNLFIKIKKYALVIQRSFRARTISKQERNRTVPDNFDPSLEKRDKAAAKIQALWRGVMVRRKVTVPKPTLNPEVPEQAQVPIQQRVRNSMATLHDQFRLTVSSAMMALANVVTATILSENACQYVVENDAVKIMFNVAAFSTKTLQNDRCVELAFEVLMCVYRSPNTTSKVWEETLKANGIEIIMDNMLKFRLEKTSKVFCKAASLLWLFSQDPAKVPVIKKVKKVSETISYLKKKSSDLVKLNPARLSSMSRTAPGSSRKSTKRPNEIAQKDKVPSLHPNWGNYFEHCLFFVKKDFALQYVVKSLKL